MNTITGTQVSKNIKAGEPITDLRELLRLAKESQAVVVRRGFSVYVQPAAFVVHQSVAQLSQCELYYTTK